MAKVLLVEDDNNLREIYEARLQAEGYDIVAARDGEEALVVAKQERPDLVVSDVMMPKISGFEMLDILRNTEGLKTVKVIMLTALGQAEDQTRADSLGADRYLVKSQVTLEDIVNAAHDLLVDAGALPADLESAPATEVTAAPEAVITAPMAVMPAPSVEPAAPAPQPVVQEPDTAPVPTPESIATPQPVVMPEPTNVPVVDTPVIPLAAAPPEIPDDTAALSMPPTPMSTIPDVPIDTPVETIPMPQPVVQEPDTALVPTPEPVAAPQPVAAPEPVSTQPIDAQPYTPEPTNAEPQTEAQETATVEQQIQNFVTSQTGAPAPQVEPTPEPVEPVTEPALQVAAPVAEPNFVPAAMPPTVETPAPSAPEVPVLEVTAPSTTTETSPEQQQALDEAVANLSAGAEGDAAPPEAISESSTRKKVIEPLSTVTNSEPKKSINELLAEEEAGQAGINPNLQPQPPVVKNDFDPNSISL